MTGQPTTGGDRDAPGLTGVPSQRPRVLQIVTHVALGGAERTVFDLVRDLGHRYEFALFAVTGIDPGPFGQAMVRELDERRVRLYVGTRVPIKRGGMLLAGVHCARAVREFQPQVIHVHTEIPEATYAAMVALHPRLKRIALVRTIHNSVYWIPWRRVGRWCERRMPEPLVNCVSRGARSAYEEFRAASGLPPLARRAEIIHSAVTVSGPPRAPDRRPGERVRLLFAGRFEVQKGADLLPDILRRVRLPPRVTCVLTLHGSGAQEPLLRELAAQPPAGWQVDLQGAVPNLAQRMGDFDLVIMPSRFEGLGLVAIESLWMGRPVVATKVAGLDETVPPDYPWLAPAGDAAAFAAVLQSVLESPDRWAAVVGRSQDFARQRFDPVVMIQSYDNLYQRACHSTA